MHVRDSTHVIKIGEKLEVPSYLDNMTKLDLCTAIIQKIIKLKFISILVATVLGFKNLVC